MWMTLLSGGELVAHGERRIMSAHEFEGLRDAADLMAQCRLRAEAIVQDGRRLATEQANAGYRDGLEQGAGACVRKLLEFERDHVASLGSREAEVLALVTLVLDRIAPSLPRGELVRALVRQAVGEARQARRLIVKVHPDLVAEVEQTLVPLRRSCAWLEALDVAGDDSLANDDCVLESPHGFVLAGWSTQRRAIEKLLAEQVAASAPMDSAA